MVNRKAVIAIESVLDKVKDKIRRVIINENGKLKSMPTSTITGVRGQHK